MSIAEGREAVRHAEWPRALAEFDAALAESSEPEAHEGRGVALWWLNDVRESHRAHEAAYRGYRARGNLGRAAYIAAWLGREQVFIDDNVSAMHGWFARAERLIADGEPEPDHGWVRIFQASMSSTPSEAKETAEHVIALARRFGDSDLEAFARATYGISEVSLGHVSNGMAALDEAMAAATGEELRSYNVVCEVFCFMLSACATVGDLVRTEHWCHVAEEHARRLGCPFLAAYCRTTYGGLLAATGQWEAAEAQLTDAIRSFEQGHRALRVHAILKLADLRVEQGRYEEAEALLSGYEDVGAALVPLARLHFARGENDLARAVIEEAVDFANPSIDQAAAFGVLVEAALAAGDDDLAGRALHGLEIIAAASDSEFLTAQALLARGRVAKQRGEPDAILHLRAALHALRRYEQSLLAGRTRLEMAHLSIEHDTAAAITWARAALATFVRLGAARDADEASGLLRRLGVTDRRGAHRKLPLSPREIEVLALIAHGLTNREIAARLVISPKTAEHHVSQVLSKLGARSRAEAATIAVVDGLME